MTRVRVDLNISIDGIAAPADQTPEHPMGADWDRLTAAYGATRTFRSRVLGDTSGAGTTGIDDEFGAAYFEGIGAEIMGAGMFGFHAHPDDPEWKGWWGDVPPFGVPVFVLTHRHRDPVEMQGGTTFHFRDASPEAVLAEATEAADGKDVRIGGGVSVVRAFLRAGLVDDLHVGIAPTVLGGQGTGLWDDLRHFEDGYDVSVVVAPSNVTHVTFRR